MQHHFDIDIAKEYGILEAVLLDHLYFWIEKNKANGTNFFDGNYWTYNSMKAFGSLFPYVTERQIRTALGHLKDKGLIETGNYNKMAFDRSLWYALTEKGNCVCRGNQMHLTLKSNGLDAEVKPIPYTNTDTYTDTNDNKSSSIDSDLLSPPTRQKQTRFTPPTLEEVKAYCAERRNGINAEAFIDYYQARGWELKKGQKVKDWRACVRTWERNGFNTRRIAKPNTVMQNEGDVDVEQYL